MEMGGKWAGWSTGNCIQAMGIQPQTNGIVYGAAATAPCMGTALQEGGWHCAPVPPCHSSDIRRLWDASGVTGDKG